MFKSMITIILAIALVAIGVAFFSVNTTIILLLEVLIVAEIVRMLANFILDTNHKVNIRYAVDGSIIYVIRELYIALTAFQQDPEMWLNIMVYMLVIGAFILMRTATITQFEMIVANRPELANDEK